jgi:hypothetical protein
LPCLHHATSPLSTLHSCEEHVKWGWGWAVATACPFAHPLPRLTFLRLLVSLCRHPPPPPTHPPTRAPDHHPCFDSVGFFQNSFYQDHAPLFNAVRQCSWALTAQAATASPTLSFAANALECPSGDEVFVPVLATGGGAGTATVAVRHLPPCTAPASLAVDVLDPGATQWRPIATQPTPTLDLTVDVQVTRSCALLRVTCVGGSA